MKLFKNQNKHEQIIDQEDAKFINENFMNLANENLTQDQIREENDQLIMMIELFRHGARRELIYIKNQRQIIDKYQDQGDLTIVGMKQHYLVGKQIREQFKDFLSEKPEYKDLILESSSSQRCLVSAQSHIMGIYDLGSGRKVESDQHYPPFEGYNQKDHDEKQYALPHQHSVYPILSNSNNQLFDVWGCKITTDVVVKNFDIIDKKYHKVFQSLYDNLEKNGYKAHEIYDVEKYNFIGAGAVCDWIYTRIFYFKDFQIDSVLEEQCKYMMLINNFSRYKDKMYSRTFMHPLNNKILDIIDSKIKNKSNKTKLHILSGHDDNISTFLMNLNYDNDLCLIKEYDRKFNDNQNQDQLQDVQCYDHLLFTTNVIIQLVKNQSQYYIKLLYNGTEKFLQQSRFKLEDFQNKLKKNLDANFEQNCYQNRQSNVVLQFMICLSILLIVIVLYCFCKKRQKYYSRI